MGRRGVRVEKEGRERGRKEEQQRRGEGRESERAEKRGRGRETEEERAPLFIKFLFFKKNFSLTKLSHPMCYKNIFEISL